MKLRTLRLRVAIAAIVLWIFVIVAHVCIVSQLKDFSTDAMFKSMLPQELLLFQESGKLLSDDQVVDVRVTDVRRSLVGLNHHIWKGNCVRKIETLCNFPMFPKAPDQRKVIYRTEITEPKNATTDGHRFIGFLIPYTSGEYNFAVASNGIAEVWLSDSENWKMAKQIAFVRPLHQNSASFKQWDFNVSRTQISSGIHLKASVRYYIEMSYTFGTQNTVENFVQVAWKRSQESNFSVIEGRSLSLYTNDSELAKYKIFDDKLPDAASCDSKIEKGYYNTHMSIDTTIPYLQHTAVNQALLLCQYQPSYVLDCSNLTSFKQYDGVKRHVQRTYAYPFPVVDGSIRLRRGSNFYYEFPLDEEEALSIVSKYMEALETTYFGHYGNGTTGCQLNMFSTVPPDELLIMSIIGSTTPKSCDLDPVPGHIQYAMCNTRWTEQKETKSPTRLSHPMTYNDIAMAIDQHNSVIQVLLDLSAAFDTVDHGILLSRLSNRFGITGTVLEWFRSYLSDRT
ncbi:beta-1,4-N-acetylgalactosaminyltransferase 3-like isoform X3 [Montipora capricornis]|uniref:beta-1,4-N-acetylgalactosaminyltransferase 3-like isoform X3 n=1 Tax=Montipora capricornis TaxID=246305 RepID=UPI0035F13CA7